jgi:hypothetical protein
MYKTSSYKGANEKNQQGKLTAKAVDRKGATNLENPMNKKRDYSCSNNEFHEYLVNL